MGDVISKAANAVGGALGSAFTAPFKTIFGESCQDVCAGPWDVICFIEHLCVSNLLKLLMMLTLCYIFLLFFYLLFKIGICQCVVKSLCKVCCVACETYCYALEDCTCFCWHKLMNTKRTNRRRRRIDIEVGYTSSSESDLSNNHLRTNKDWIKEEPHTPLYSSSRNHRHQHRRAKGRSMRLNSSRGLKINKVRSTRRIRRKRK